jgi:hypothetical protein
MQTGEQTYRQIDRQIEMTKTTVALGSSANAPKNATKIYPKNLKETYYFGKRSKDGMIILKQELNKKEIKDVKQQLLKTNKCTTMYCVYSKTCIKTLKKLTCSSTSLH